MNTVDESELKNGRSCLLVFRNKKINYFDGANKIISSYASVGYYFDKISYLAFDEPDEIVRALKEGVNYYENIIIYCPCQMEATFKNYFKRVLSEDFNEINILKSNSLNVFLLYSDSENRLLFDDIKKVLDGKYCVQYGKDYVKTVGAPAAKINSAVKQAKAVCPEINFNVSESFGDCCIEVIYSDKVSKIVHDKAMRTLLTMLNDYVYAIEDISLAEKLYELLKLRRMKISVAESFTGGGVSKKLVEVPGISEVFFEGLNTYSNESKNQRLGVQELTLHRFGAVSEQTAYEMAYGLLKSGNCDISIATTGIAGPKSDNTSKPVGLIYIAVGMRENVFVHKYNLKGDRNNITNTAINLALFHAYKTLK